MIDDVADQRRIGLTLNGKSVGNSIDNQTAICFVAGTQVIVGINDDGSYITRNIEDLAAGDVVLARDQYDEGDDVDLRRVVRLFRKTSDHLRIVRIQDANGNVETIQTTDEHPFYIAGLGWVAAKGLLPGDRLNEADGSNDSRVLSSIREDRPDGVAVYNFEVEGDHTYFVEDGIGPATAVWVHNQCKIDIAARVRLDKVEYGLSRDAHAAIAFDRLRNRAAKDAAYANQLQGFLGRKGMQQLMAGETLSDWVWHHALRSQAWGQEGWLWLARYRDHNLNHYKLFHPNGYGGYSEWAVPAGAPRRTL